MSGEFTIAHISRCPEEAHQELGRLRTALGFRSRRLAELERVLDMVAKCCYPTNFMFQVEKIREALAAVGNLSPGLPESLREAARVAAEHLETRPDMTEGDAAISSMLRAALATVPKAAWAEREG